MATSTRPQRSTNDHAPRTWHIAAISAGAIGLGAIGMTAISAILAAVAPEETSADVTATQQCSEDARNTMAAVTDTEQSTSLVLDDPQPVDGDWLVTGSILTEHGSIEFFCNAFFQEDGTDVRATSGSYDLSDFDADAAGLPAQIDRIRLDQAGTIHASYR